jgi:hypothetical protein
MRWKLSGKKHAVPLKDGSAGHDEWRLLNGLEIAIVERHRSGAHGGRRMTGEHVLMSVVHILARVVGVLSRLAARRGSISTCRPSLDSWAFDTVGSRSHISRSWRRRGAPATALSPHEVGP